MTKKVNKIISAETIADGIFDRDQVLTPYRSMFYASNKKKDGIRVTYYDNAPGLPKPKLGEGVIFLS